MRDLYYFFIVQPDHLDDPVPAGGQTSTSAAGKSDAVEGKSTMAIEPAGYRTPRVISGSNRMVIHMFSKLATSDTEELSEVRPFGMQMFLDVIRRKVLEGKKSGPGAAPITPGPLTTRSRDRNDQKMVR